MSPTATIEKKKRLWVLVAEIDSWNIGSVLLNQLQVYDQWGDREQIFPFQIFWYFLDLFFIPSQSIPFMGDLGPRDGLEEEDQKIINKRLGQLRIFLSERIGQFKDTLKGNNIL